MTVKSGFFSDGSSYNQADFNAFLLDSIGSGYVLGYENELEVTPNTPANMGVIVRTGRCYVQGYYGWVISNEALTVPAADATYPRIDRVVARLSVSVNQSVTFAVLTGTPAASPSAPALTRTSETYEISLARIAVGAGVTSIVAANITDERPDATVCGVAGVKHSWSYLNNVVIDVSSMTIDAGVSDRDPVYFNGTKWVVATNGAVGFYDEANDAVITAGYLDGFTGLTPGAVVGNRGVALTTTKIVVLEIPVNTIGDKLVGNITGNLTGDISGYIKRKIIIGTSPGLFNLGELIPAKTESNTNNTSLSGDLATGIVARTTLYGAIDPAFGIIKNLGYGSAIPYNVTVILYHNGILNWTITTKTVGGTTIQTYSGSGEQSIPVTVQVTSLTDTISYTISSAYANSNSASIVAYSASFD